MYRTDVYFLSKTIAELGIYILFPFIAFAIPYYIIGLNPAVERFFIGAGIVILVTNVATSFGELCKLILHEKNTFLDHINSWYIY